MEVEVAKITLSDTIPAQHQIMRQQKGVKTSKPAKHTSSRLVVCINDVFKILHETFTYGQW